MHNIIGSFEIGVMIDDRTTPEKHKTPVASTSILDYLIRIFADFSINY
ncbi:TPA: hypothetical protein L4G11_001236 [Pseudomonas aeruginosa]|nr:hypothetical protein [Pseudomonas aeruginosa]